MDAQRENGALLIAASIIAAIRLREEPIKPSPKLTVTIVESVLAGWYCANCKDYILERRTIINIGHVIEV